MREQHAAETDEQREVRLQRMREHEHERRNAEYTEQRDLQSKKFPFAGVYNK